MQQVFRAIGRLSRSSVTVLITGESGTGKELVARALHEHSPRAAQALHRAEHLGDPGGPARVGTVRPREAAPSPAPTACAAAASNRPTAARCSWMRSATCRTPLQTRLLRVLAEGEFYRVGGQTPIRVDVRVIAATHQNLAGAGARAALFREDLYHRLNVIRIELPPLRARARGHPGSARCTTCTSRPRSSASSPRRSRPKRTREARGLHAGRATCASW